MISRTRWKVPRMRTTVWQVASSARSHPRRQRVDFDSLLVFFFRPASSQTNRTSGPCTTPPQLHSVLVHHQHVTVYTTRVHGWLPPQLFFLRRKIMKPSRRTRVKTKYEWTTLRFGVKLSSTRLFALVRRGRHADGRRITSASVAHVSVGRLMCRERRHWFVIKVGRRDFFDTKRSEKRRARGSLVHVLGTHVL